MPKNKSEKRLRTRELNVVEYYTDPMSDTYNNWSESYKKAGYSKCHGWMRNSAKVRSKQYIQDAITAKRRESTAKIDVTREYCIERLYQIAETSKTERNVISAIATIGDFAGFKRENAPNEEREQARKALKDKELTELERLSRARTEELSHRPVIRQIGA